MLTKLLNIMKYSIEKSPLRLGRLLVFGLLFAVMTPMSAYGQEPADEEFYDDEYIEDDFDSDDYFDDEYYEDGEELSDDEFYDDDEYADDEFYDDEFADDEGFEDEFYDDEFTEDDDFSDDEFSDEELGAFEAADDEGLDLADDQAGEVELAEVEKKEIKEPRIPWGYTAKVTMSSPWLVGISLDEWWYSTFDIRATLDFPTKTIAGQSLTYGIEISTYNFEHTHPSGGQFAGGTILGVAKFPWGPLNLTAGVGMYGFDVITGGMVFGAEYTLPFIKIIDISLESRMNYVMKSTANANGAAYWFDVAGSLGFKF